MSQPLPMHLRLRMSAAVDDGMSCLAAAAHIGVVPSVSVRWSAQRRDADDCAGKSQSGDMPSHRVEERASDILAVWEKRKEVTFSELRLALAQMGLAVSVAGHCRFFARRGMARKKSYGHAIEQGRPEVLRQRHRWLMARSVSIRSAWSPSTRPRLRPT